MGGMDSHKYEWLLLKALLLWLCDDRGARPMVGYGHRRGATPESRD